MRALISVWMSVKMNREEWSMGTSRQQGDDSSPLASVTSRQVVMTHRQLFSASGRVINW